MTDASEQILERAAALYADDRLEDARAMLEEAFVALRDRGDLPAAAITAARLGELHAGSLGNEAVGRGWIERARRMLEQVGPCVEWGYWELARLACNRPDVDDLQRSAERALAVAREFGDLGLEVRALADLGLALVSQGRVRDGFARLDEALAMISAGEVRDAYVVSTSLCSLLSSCDRAGDVERALESIRMTEHLVLEPLEGRPKVLGTHCKLALGGVLCAAGRLSEAEAALLEAIGPNASRSSGHRVEATARLAELRLHQGRLDDAADLLVRIEDSIAAALPLAMMHLRRGDPDLAAGVLRNAVRRMSGDVVRGGPLVSLLVEAELMCGELERAREAALLLRSMAAAVELPAVAVLATVADARLAAACGEPAVAVDAFEAALGALDGGQHPLLAATVQVELAEAQAALGDTGAALASARAAHTSAQRLGATVLGDRAAATMRRLGSTPPRPVATGDSLAGLTARELDVLAGIRRGDTNAEIAATLYLSPKTVEHHVGRILGKLGVRTRAEAAAVAARSGPATGV